MIQIHTWATESHSLHGGNVEIFCFGRTGPMSIVDVQDWSLAGDNPEAVSQSNPIVLHRIAALAQMTMANIYAPNPSRFNAKICRTNQLGDEWLLGALYRGQHADGVLLDKPGTAFAVASADCPTLVLHDTASGHTVAAHAGLNSLIDRQHLMGHSVSPRQPENVVTAAVDTLRTVNPDFNPTKIRAFIACGIGPQFFCFPAQDPVYGATNRRLNNAIVRRHGPVINGVNGGPGRLDLKALITSLLAEHEIPPWAVGGDTVDTYGDTDLCGSPRWHSYRRRRGTPQRNLVLVVRNQ